MKRINCVIIDDDMASISLLMNYIKKVKRLNLVGYFTSPIEALEKIAGMDVDLIFLDIEMEELKGTEIVVLLDAKIKVIFCTGYDDFAVESYEYNAVDYVIKPFSLKRFLLAVRKVEQLMQLTPSVSALDADEAYFLVYAGGKHRNIKIDYCDVDYIEAERNGCTIYLANREPLKITYSIKKIYEGLPKDKFLRVHKSYVISLSRYHCYDKGFIKLTGGERKLLPVGEGYMNQLLKWISDHAILK